jgi:hypothetical protein
LIAKTENLKPHELEQADFYRKTPDHHHHRQNKEQLSFKQFGDV